jgi:cytochrome c peroxidase
MRNEAFYVMKWDKGQFVRSTVRLTSSSLASQASGPPLSGVEMSCKGRDFTNLAQKLLEQPILSGQTIAVDDSVLGNYARNRPTYAALIRSAFNSAYWTASVPVRFERGMLPKIESMDLVDRPPLRTRPAPTDLTQMQANFSLFFGLALQLYESTLVANDTPYDRHAEGRSTLSGQQLRGLQVFNGQGRCVSCHGGPEFTNASVRNVLSRRIESMTMGDGGTASYDSGFYNIGVRPTSEDAGVGGSDPFNKPFSETGMAQLGLTGQLGNDFNRAVEAAVTINSRLATAGAFTAPGLRNVELTGPYFHNGGKATLMQVVNFYDRGGDFADSNRATLAPDIQPLGLSSTQKEDLVAFLLSLTDERVRLQRAPFDHPSLCLPHGQGGVASGGVMGDTMECLPEVGGGGVAAAAGLKPFLGLSPFSSPEPVGGTASVTTTAP